MIVEGKIKAILKKDEETMDDDMLLYLKVCNGGFLTMDEDHLLHLTDVGREVAEKIYERHCFFTEQLIAAGVDPETAEVDACRIEHVISNESFERLKEAAFRNQENEISALSKEIKDKPTE